jgi:hypothetical protein
MSPLPEAGMNTTKAHKRVINMHKLPKILRKTPELTKFQNNVSYLFSLF